MVRKLITWSLDNPLVVIVLAIFLASMGLFSFLNVNVEAYPDPAPAIVEVIALFPGASAEEVERQVTVPLEVAFGAMPGLKKINSKSLFGLSDVKMTWYYGDKYTYQTCRQEVINRMATMAEPMPSNVIPQVSPMSPTGEIYRYMLTVPKNESGREIYTLNDIKAMQDWVLEREFRRVQRVVDVIAEPRVMLLLLAEAVERLHVRTAVRAVHPGHRRPPLELGDLRRVGQGVADAEQRFDVDAVVDRDLGCGHCRASLLSAFSRDPEMCCLLSAPETAYAPDGCGIRPSCMSSETWS